MRDKRLLDRCLHVADLQPKTLIGTPYTRLSLERLNDRLGALIHTKVSTHTIVQ
jgi:hypothetical protein